MPLRFPRLGPAFDTGRCDGTSSASIPLPLLDSGFHAMAPKQTAATDKRNLPDKNQEYGEHAHHLGDAKPSSHEPLLLVCREQGRWSHMRQRDGEKASAIKAAVGLGGDRAVLASADGAVAVNVGFRAMDAGDPGASELVGKGDGVVTCAEALGDGCALLGTRQGEGRVVRDCGEMVKWVGPLQESVEACASLGREGFLATCGGQVGRFPLGQAGPWLLEEALSHPEGVTSLAGIEAKDKSWCELATGCLDGSVRVFSWCPSAGFSLASSAKCATWSGVASLAAWSSCGTQRLAACGNEGAILLARSEPDGVWEQAARVGADLGVRSLVGAGSALAGLVGPREVVVWGLRKSSEWREERRIRCPSDLSFARLGKADGRLVAGTSSGGLIVYR